LSESFLRLLHFGFQVTDELLEVVAALEWFWPRVMTELVGVVEAGGDEVAEGLDCPVRGIADARAGGQSRDESEVMGKVVEVAGLPIC
jgi:hypothetical protein